MVPEREDETEGVRLSEPVAVRDVLAQFVVERDIVCEAVPVVESVVERLELIDSV